MAPTFLLYLQKNNVQLTIIIGKDGTPSYCKARLIMLVDLSMCMCVFSNSSLYRKGQSNSLFPGVQESIASREVPLVILGDPAYPLLTWLMKAFPNNGRLSQQQKHFNYRLSRARVVVEHCYGRLKGRWRCLLKRLDVDVNYASKVVAACCVLHNICEIHGDAFDDDWLNGTDDQTLETNLSTVSSNQPTEGAVDIRNAFMSYFNQ